MIKTKDLLFYGVLAMGIAIFFAMGQAKVTASPYNGRPEIVAATFTSAWCTACKVLEPKLAKVIPDFAAKPVNFIEFSFTFGEQADHKKLAAKYSMMDIYERFKGSTGYTLLINPDTGEIIDVLTMDHSKPAMRAAIAQAIAIAERTDGAGPEWRSMDPVLD